MILILISLIAIIVLGIWGHKSNRCHFFVDFICSMVAFIGFIGLFLYAILVWSYFSAEYKVNIVNREYGTNYTQLEMFYASDVIETVRELDRKRIELNGNILDKNKSTLTNGETTE